MMTCKWTMTSALATIAILPTSGAVMADDAKTLRIGLIEDVDTLDPDQGRTLGGRQVFAALCDKLFDIDEGANIVGQLVDDHTVSDDGKTISLTLKEGVVFHDGTPLDAEAVKFNIERSLTLPESARKGNLRAISSVEVTGPLTVDLILSEPFAPLLAQLADRGGMMVSPAAAAEMDAAAFGQSPVCSGPFRFVERVVQDRIVLDRFENYWNPDAINVDRVVYLPVPDATVRLNNLFSGQLDIIEQVATSDLERVRENPNFQIMSGDGLGHFHMIFNTGNGAGADSEWARHPELRHAMNAAIDREIINEVVFGGNFAPGNQTVPPSSPYYAASLPVPARDVERAKALIEEAGVSDPSLQITVNNNPTFLRVAQVIQSMAAEAGIDVEIRPMEANTATAAVNGGEFESFLSFWSGRADPDGNTFNYLGCDGASNPGKYCNEQVEALLAEASKVSDPATRAGLYEDAAKLWMEDAPLLIIYHSKHFFGAGSGTTGFTPVPDGIVRVEGISKG